MLVSSAMKDLMPGARKFKNKLQELGDTLYGAGIYAGTFAAVLSMISHICWQTLLTHMTKM
jgi:hypothetical protein